MTPGRITELHLLSPDFETRISKQVSISIHLDTTCRWSPSMLHWLTLLKLILNIYWLNWFKKDAEILRKSLSDSQRLKLFGGRLLTIQNYPKLFSKRLRREFLGFTVYYRWWGPSFSEPWKPFNELRSCGTQKLKMLLVILECSFNNHLCWVFQVMINFSFCMSRKVQDMV